jgi:Concanavalin A-like lectin/glucanases superfamily
MLETSCGNGVRDGEETGVDCGPGCEPCQRCNNGVQDSDETGVDCGGTCAACPSCDDGKRNGSESDVDCGGTCAQRCGTDLRCLEAADCASLVCASVCQPATCTDTVRNGAESSVDCGGGACPNCPSGQPCRLGSDCQTGLCQQELCVSLECSNGNRDNEETDVDCGGPECAPCPDQGKCLSARDCASNECDSSGVCSQATCSDAKLNQDESSVDCGGPECPACADGSACKQSSDCASSLCQSGTCVKTCAGYALSFDGDALVKVDRPVEDDFTIEAWIKTTAKAADGAHYWTGGGLFWADVLGSGDDFGASVLGSHVAFGTGRADGGEVNLIGSVSVNSGNWTHVAVTRQRSAEQLQIFINGTLDRTVTDASQTEPLTGSASLQIGGNSNDKRYYRGVIDEVRVWNVVRTAAQLGKNKNRRLAGNEAGLVAYWRFDDGIGLLATDSGPSQNHGVLQGPPQWILSDAPLCP